MATRKCTRCERNRQAKFFSGPRGRICTTCQKRTRSKASHESRVMATYGLGPGEYDSLFEAQGGRCAICQGTRKTRLDVDHDHKTGLVRGLCCARCNRQLLARGLRDRPEVARRAAEYLENPPAVRVVGQRFYRKQT